MWLVGVDIASATLFSNYIHERTGIGVTPTSKDQLPPKSSDPVIVCCRYRDCFFKNVKSLLVKVSKRTPRIILLVGMYTRTQAELIQEARDFRIGKHIKSNLTMIGYISEPSEEQLYTIKASVPLL